MFIKKLKIENFKSIQSLSLNKLGRINLFIGKPNVDKSNIIEALSLFTLPDLRKNQSLAMNQLVRMETIGELFHNGEQTIPISVSADEHKCTIHFDRERGLSFVLNGQALEFDQKLALKKSKALEKASSPIKRYIFKAEQDEKAVLSPNQVTLNPPFGNNLQSVLELLPELKKSFDDIFGTYGLELIYDRVGNSLKIMRKSQGGTFLLPYNSVADTLRRIIFFRTAIQSNKNAVLLFEEPEAHAYPPYISQITQEIIQSKTNQFFITTHSPFVINDFLENALGETTITIVDYKRNETKAKTLTKEELENIYRYGIDLFTNTETFL